MAARVGSTLIAGMYYTSSPIGLAYRGSELVWSSGGIVIPDPDLIPNAFDLVDVTGIARNLLTTSEYVIPMGYDAATTISIVGGEYQIGVGAWTAGAGFIMPGQAVRVRGTSSGSYSTATNVTLTIGGVQSVFTITTAVAPAADTVPNAFNFTDVTGAELTTLTTSNQIIPDGYDSTATVTITGGEYQIDSGSWVTSSGSINPGQGIRVRRSSSGSNSTAATVILTIGGVSDTWSVTTKAAAVLPSFTVQPTMTGDGTPVTGEALNLTYGTIINGTTGTKVILDHLGSLITTIAAGTTWTPTLAGQYRLRVYTNDPTIFADTALITVATASGGAFVAPVIAMNGPAGTNPPTFQIVSTGDAQIGNHYFRIQHGPDNDFNNLANKTQETDQFIETMIYDDGYDWASIGPSPMTAGPWHLRLQVLDGPAGTVLGTSNVITDTLVSAEEVPVTIFGAPNIRGWWDYADSSKIFSDTAGTTGSVLNGDIRRINDKSGNGIYLTGPAGMKWKQDGDRFYVNMDNAAHIFGSINNLDLTAHTKIDVFAAVKFGNNTNLTMVFEHTDNAGSGNKGFFLIKGLPTGGKLRARYAAVVDAPDQSSGADLVENSRYVIHYQIDVATDKLSVTLSPATTSITETGTDLVGKTGASGKFYIGNRSDISLGGAPKEVTEVIVVSGGVTTQQRTDAIAYLNGKLDV